MAKRARAASAVLIGMSRQRRASLMLGTALQASALMALSVPARAQSANASPQGGVVSAGAAAISATANNTLIIQQSQRAVVDWKSFDVGSKQSVTFQQPGSQALVLNRVDAAHPSQIAGSITANGQVIIENQSGVVFANGAEVNAAGLLVTSSGITNQNFMAGNMAFDIPAHPNARIVNRGHITINDAGLAALVAPSVANSGVITARLGTVVLAGAVTHTVDMYGDGLLSVDVTGEVRQAPIGPDGRKVQVLVTNTGTISAAGGSVVLTAQAADGIVSTLVQEGGNISADSVGGQTGSIQITGIGGSITVDGLVSAAGRAPGTGGGQIELDATDTVAVGAKARITASGQAGGGTVAIGTTLARARGGAAVVGAATAQTTTIAAGARISADATRSGNGGQVTVLSSHQTSMGGRITARGGRLGGDGGSVEVSGAAGYALTGSVDVSAKHGAAGSILIDPTDLVIATGGGGTITASGQSGTLLAGDSPGNATIDPSVFAGLTGNVTLDAANDLTVTSTFTASAGQLLLQAGHDLTVNAPIGLSGSGTITLAAAVATPEFTGAAGYDPVNGPNGVLSLAAGSGLSGSAATAILISGVGGISVNAPISVASLVASTTGAVSIASTVSAPTANITANSVSITAAGALTGSTLLLSTSGGGAIEVAGSLGATGALSVTAGTAFSESGTGVVSAGTLTGSAGSVALAGANAIARLGAFTATGALALTDSGALSIVGAANAGSADLTASAITVTAGGSLGSAGNVTLDATGSTIAVAGGLSAATLTLTAGTGITEGGSISATTLTGSAASAALTGTNSLTNLGAFSTTGNFSLTNAGSLTLAGNVTAGTPQPPDATNGATITLGTSAGTLALSAGTLSAGTVSLSAAGDITQGAGVVDAYVLTIPAAGNVTLGNGSNTITALGAVAPTGSLSLSDGGALNVGSAISLTASGQTVSLTATGGLGISAPVTADGDISLTARPGTGGGLLNIVSGSTITSNNGSVYLVGGTAGVTIAAPIAAVGHVISVTGDSVTRTADTTDTLDAGSTGTVEFAPYSALAVTLGTAVSGYGIDPTGVTAGTLRVGGATTATDSTPMATASSIIVPATGFDATGFADLELDTTGAVSQAASSALTGVTRLGGIADSVTLGAAGSTATIAALGDFITTNGFSLTDGTAFTVLGTVSAAGTSTLSLISPGSIDIGQAGTAGALNAGTVSLSATGDIAETDGAISAGLLSVPNVGTLALGGANLIGALGAVTASGAISITDGETLTILGTVATGAAETAVLDVTAGDLQIGQVGTAGAINAGTVSLSAAGTVGEPDGTISATLLTIPSAGTVALGGANTIADLGSTVSGGAFALTDGQSLSVLGTVLAGSTATLALDVTSGDLAIGQTGTAGLLNAGTVSLSASGTISEANGTIGAATLLIPTAAVVGLTGANAITYLGTVAAGGDVSLVDAQGLTIIGGVSAGAANVLTLTIDGDLAIGTTGTAGSLAAGSVALIVSGAISEPNGVISATTLSGPGASSFYTSASSVALNGAANAVADLGSFVSAGGFSFVDGQDFTVLGTITTPGTASLSLAGSGALAIGATGTVGLLNGGTVALDAAGAITEPNGTIEAALLNGPSSGALYGTSASATLTGGNSITALGDFASAGGISLTDMGALTVVGTVTAGTASSLLLTTDGGLTLGQTGTVGLLGAGNVVLATSGTISEPDGVINAGTLSGAASGVTRAVLEGANSIDTLGSFATSGGFSLNDIAPLSVIATVQVGAAQTLELAAPGLAISGTLVASAASGVVAGSTEVAAGAVLLQTDTFSLTGSIESPAGVVAIAPLTQGRTESVDATSVAGDLSLLTADLARIDTIFTPGGSTVAVFGNSYTGAAPTGTQTLMLGSVDGQTALAGAVLINTSLDLTGIANTLAVFSTGTVAQPGGALSVQALTGSSGGGIGLTAAGNQISYLGNTATRAAIDVASAFTGSLTAGGGLSLVDGDGLAVVGLVQVGAGSTLALTAPSLVIDSRYLPNDTLAPGDNGASNNGTLLAPAASAVVAGVTTVTPGVIALSTDALQLLGNTAATPDVYAPGGTVAIAPRTAGDTMSIDATRANTATDLSLTPTDLSFIDTVRAPGDSVPALTGSALVAGPAGTQTLMLGSLDGQSLVAGGISINTAVAFGAATADAGGTPIISAGNVATLALYSDGSIGEGSAGAITVNTLVAIAGITPGAAAASGLGDITLGGANLIGGLGDSAVSGGLASAVAVRGVAASGNILIANAMSVTVAAGSTLQAGQDPTLAFHGVGSSASLEIDVTGTGAGLTVAGTAQAGFDTDGTVGLAGDVTLRAGSDSVAGTISVPGAVYAEPGAGAGLITLTAGYDSAGTLRNTSCGAGSCAITIAGTLAGNAATAANGVTLLAGGQIVESGSIIAAELSGASGYSADLRGASQTANSIATLGGWDSNLAATDALVTAGFGFMLNDGAALTTSGAVSDHGGAGLSISVAGPGDAAAELALDSAISAPGATVRLEATGDVYEGTSQVITAGTLTGEAGFVPEAAGGAAPGTLPGGASLQPVSLASGYFGQDNAIGTLGNFSATDSLVLINAGSLAVDGSVLAGAAASGLAASPLFTQPTGLPSVDITIGTGALSVGGTILAGFGGGLPNGSVTLTAGSSTTAGSVSILSGGTVGAQDGAIILAAGVTGDPTGAGAVYNASCGSCTISVAGAIGLVAPQTLTSAVGLYAPAGVSETGSIAASGLQGQAGIAPSSGSAGVLASVDLPGATLTSNAIAAISGFSATGSFVLDDGVALTIGGTLAAATAGLVTPGVGGSAFDVTLDAPGIALTSSGRITDGVAAAGTPGGTTLAGGNVVLEGGSLDLSGGVLVPGGENGGGTLTAIASGTIGQTGTLTALALTGSAASADFAGATPTANTLAVLQTFTTTGGFLLNDSTGLLVMGGVSAGSGATLGLTVDGTLTLGNAGTAGVLSGGTVALDAPGAISEANGFIDATLLTGPAAGLTYASASSVVLGGANAVAGLGSFVSAAGFGLTDSEGLTVLGTVQTGPGALLGLSVDGALAIGNAGTAGVLNGGTVALDASGVISEANGAIDATLLTGPSVGLTYASASSATLDGGNTIATLGSFTTSGDFGLVDGTGLLVLGSVSAGSSSTLGLTAGGALTLGNVGTAGVLSGGTVALDAPGVISEVNGSIDATLLTGPSVGATYASASSVALGGANAVAGLGSFVSASGFGLTDTEGLSVLGTVRAGSGALLALTVDGSLTIGSAGTAGALDGGSVALVASGDIGEPNGSIAATLLTGSSPGAAYAVASSVSLDGVSNAIGTLGAFAASGDFGLVDGTGLLVLGSVSAGSSSTLGLTAGGALTLGNAGTAGMLSGGTVALDASGVISEVNGGIDAAILTGPQTGLAYVSAASVTLDAGNTIATLGAFASTGNFGLVDSTGLLVMGGVSAGSGATLGLTVDGALTLGNAGTAGVLSGGTVALDAPGAISEANGFIDATLLTGPAAGLTYASASSVVLGGANAVAGLGSFVSAAGFGLTDSEGLTVLGTVQTGPGALLGLSVDGALAIGNAGTAGVLNGGTVALDASGVISEANGAIDATLLTGPSVGLTYASASSATLDGGNTIATLGSFTTSGDFGLVDGTGLLVLGSVSAGSSSTLGLTAGGALTLGNAGTAGMLSGGTVALDAPGVISEVNGSIGATLLTGPSVGLAYASASSATLDGGNTITTLGSFATTGNFGLVDGTGLVVLGGVSAGSGSTLGLTADGALTLGDVGTAGELNGGTVALDASGVISEVNGAIDATLLTGPSVGLTYASASSATLDGGNTIATLGSFTTSGDFGLVDGTGLVVMGSVSAGSSSTLGLTAGGALTLGNVGTAGVLSGGTVALDAPGVISEVNGSIGATLLTGPSLGLAYASASSATLDGGNTITTLGSFATTGNFGLVDGTGLVVLGSVSAGSAATLGLTADGALTLGNAGTAGVLSGGTVALDAPGVISEVNGSIGATLLTGSAPRAPYAVASSVSLDGVSNAIGTLGAFAASGDFGLVDGTGLLVLGTVSAGSSSTLGLTAGGALTLGNAGTAGVLSGGTVALDAPGVISEANGSIAAALLTGPGVGLAYASASSATLDGGNTIATLGSFATSGDFGLVDGTGLVVLGSVSAGSGSTLGLTVDGALTLGNAGTAGVLSGGTVALDAPGVISEVNGSIGATLLTGPSVGATYASASSVALGGANAVAGLGNFVSASGFGLTDTEGLSVLGTVRAGSGALLALTVDGSLTIGSAGTAGALDGGSVALVASGDIGEPNGSIAATLLTGSSPGAAYAVASSVSLDGVSNAIGTLGAFAASGDFGLVDGTGLLVLGSVSAGSSSTLGLTAGGALTLGNAGTAGMLSGGTVALDASGVISEVNGGIDAAILTGPQTGLAYVSAASVTLDAGNTIATLGAFASTGNFGLVDSTGLLVMGGVSAGSGATLGLTVDGTLTLGNAGTAGVLSGGTVALDAPGAISEANGFIDATLLTGPAAGLTYASASSVVLGGANAVAGLGSFVSAAGFGLTDSEGLTVLGTVQTGPGALLGLSVDGALAIGNAGTAGVLNGGTVALDASGVISEANGSIDATLLTGPSVGLTYASASSATLDGGNTIATLGSFATTGNFGLVDGTGLVVLGSVSAGSGSTLGLTVDGALTLGNAGTAGVLSGGTVALDAPGVISEVNGSIGATLLTGPSVGAIYASASSVALGGANAVAALGSFVSASGFGLTDTEGLSVLGTVRAGSGALLALTVDGSLTIGSAGTAGALDGGSVALVASGDIGEPNGSIAATLLTGSSPGAAYAVASSVSLGANNSIVDLGNFAASGNFILTDAPALTVTGTVSAGPTSSLALTGIAGITLGTRGNAALLTAGTVILSTPGAISEPNGVIDAAALAGPQAGQLFTTASSASLTGANDIGTLNGFATTGDLLLNDVGSLTVVGPILAGSVLAPNAANAATLTLLLPGQLTLGVSGAAATLNAGTVVLDAGGGIDEVNGGIGANLLTGPTGGAVYAIAGGPIALGGANSVTTLGGMATSAGSITFQDLTNLSIAGPLSAADSVAVSDDGGLTLTGAIIAGNGVSLSSTQSISQSGGAITASGPGGVSLNATGGAISQSSGGIINATAAGAPVSLLAADGIGIGGYLGGTTPSITLSAGAGAIGETVDGADTGRITAAALSGSAAGGVALDSGGNSIASVGSFASGAGFTLVDQSGLHVLGDIIAPAAILINDAGVISQDGGIIQSIDGTVLLNGTTGIGIGGSVLAASVGGVLTLTAPAGGISESPNAQIQASDLLVNAAGSVVLNANNHVSEELGLTTAGLLQFADAQDLTFAGQVTGNGGVLVSSTGNLFVPAGLQITSSDGAVALQAGGVFDQGARSVISGGSVSITAVGTVSLAGTLAGERIVVAGPGDTPAGTVNVLNGAVISTGSAGSFQLTQAFSTLPSRDGGSPGAYFYTSEFVQTGVLTVTGLGGNGASTMRIDTFGDVLFDLTNGLDGPGTTLIENILGTGTAMGNIVVKGFFVNYPSGVQASADLTGTVNGVGGQSAAQGGAIAPQQNSRFRFNSCPIGSVNCIVLPIEGVPVLDPTSELDFADFQDNSDNSDLLLPLISDKDY